MCQHVLTSDKLEQQPAPESGRNLTQILETPEDPRQLPKAPEHPSLFLERPYSLGDGHQSGAASGDLFACLCVYVSV